MMDDSEITQRLRDSGDQPVPGEVRRRHLDQMHAATPTVERPKRFGRLAVAAAAVVGFAVGSTGFAMAGALPAPAQRIAHDVLSVVNVDVEDPGSRGRCVSAAARTHGDDEAAKQAAKDACPKGKTAKAGQGKGKGRPEGVGRPGGLPHAEDPCKGPPPWAGNTMDAAAKEQARADRADQCGRDLDDDGAEIEREAREGGRDTQSRGEETEQSPPAEQPGAEQDPAGQSTPGEAEAGEPPVELPGPLQEDTDTGEG